jgi:hypothetical protein
LLPCDRVCAVYGAVRNLHFTLHTVTQDTDRTQDTGSMLPAILYFIEVVRFDVYLPVNPSNEASVGDNKISFNRCYLCKSLLSETLN